MQPHGPTIRRLREESGYGLRAFADLVGISASWLSRIESGKAHPSPDVLKRIALALAGEDQARAAISRIARYGAEGSDDRCPSD